MLMPWGRAQQGCSVTNLQGTRSLSHSARVNTTDLPRPPATPTSLAASSSASSLGVVGGGGGGGVVVVVVVVVVDVVMASVKYFSFVRYFHVMNERMTPGSLSGVGF